MSPPSSSDGAFLHSTADLGPGDVEALLAAAADIGRDGRGKVGRGPFTVGLLFLAPSLRSRVGFAVATSCLGGTPVEVLELRRTPEMSMPESFDDTLRVLSGMVDVTVVRTPFELDRDRAEAALVSAYVNAGDGDANHPTQALIDLFAIDRLRGPHRELRIGICGSLDSRSARSLVEMLDKSPPASLSLIAPAGRDELAVRLGAELGARLTRREPGDFTDLDVLYMAGLPAGPSPGSADAELRREFALDEDGLRRLPADATVLAPMPIVDEISPEARCDPRVRMFDQSDWGVHVRMAVLEALVNGRITGR